MIYFQYPNLDTCILLDNESCLVYFAYSEHGQVFREHERICPTVTRYDDNQSFISDLVQYSPLFDVDFVCAASSFAWMVSSVV